MEGWRGPARREPRLSCGTPEGRLTVAPFRAWRGWASRVAQGRDPRPADPEDLAYYRSRGGAHAVEAPTGRAYTRRTPTKREHPATREPARPLTELLQAWSDGDEAS